MARARILKPDFFDDEKLAEIPFTARLLFQALWTLADREGRLEDRPEKIAAFAFPYDKPLQIKARKEAPKMLDILIETGCVERYQISGKACLWLPHFKDHQKTHDREAQSVLPPPPGKQGIAQGAPRPAQGVKSLPEAEAVSESVREAESEAGAEAREGAPDAPTFEAGDGLFAREYVRHYQEQHAGAPPSPIEQGDARRLERDFGTERCMQAGNDTGWTKHPNWLRKKLEDPNYGRAKTNQRSNGRSAGSGAVLDESGLAELRAYAAGADLRSAAR